MFILEHRPRLVGVVGSPFTSSPLGFEAENPLECDNPPAVYPLTWGQTSGVLPASEPCPSGHRDALSSLLVVHSGDCATLTHCWRSC